MSHYTIPRSQQLGHLVTGAVLAARMQWREYAGAVVEHYHGHVAPAERVVPFHLPTSADDFDHASRLNTQTVRRLLGGEIRMPSDIEESLVAALPPAQREQVLTSLLARQGLLLAHVPPAADDAAGQIGTPCELLRRAATAVERIAPMLSDGVICPKDAPYFAEALGATTAVMGVCVTIQAQIAGAMCEGQGKAAGQGRAH